MKECTFEPKILSKSREKVKGIPTPRYVLLHEDYHLRETKRELSKKQIYKEKLTFHPHVNEVSTAITKGRPFFKRLHEYDEVRKSKEKERETTRKSR